MSNLPAGSQPRPEAPGGTVELPVELGVVELDPEEAARRKAARLEHLHTVTIPALRFLGFAALSLGIYVYLRFFEQQADAARVALTYAGGSFVYCLAVAVALRTFYERLPGNALAVAFLALDMVLQTVAIYVTGGEESWLVALLLLRMADQATSGRRRALFFAHWGALCFLGLTAYLDFGEGRSIDWAREMTKAGLLYGAGLWVAVSASPADRRRRQVSAAIDATRAIILELEAATCRLEEAKILAEAASQAKSQFVANMSHELRTPLVAVVGVADLLAKEDLSPGQHEYVSLLQTSAASLLHLMDDTLDFSKIEAGKLTVDTRPCRLEAVVEEVVRFLGPKALEKGVELRCTVPLDLPLVITDPARLRQVLLNLVGNAVKFTSRGSVDVRLLMPGGEGEQRARFEVEDTGIGIPEEQQGSLFEPFTQADASSTRSYGGMGLGLSIARRLVDLLGGTIGLASRSGVGSTFWFELPLETAETERAETEVESEQTAVAAPLPTPVAPRVLLAEDNPVNSAVVAALLDTLGAAVETVGDGREAVAAVTREPFDLVLMDCQMPVMNGYEATREIRLLEREGDRRLPIVALTAHALAGERDRCLEVGMDDYLSKPVRQETLARMLTAYCEPPLPEAPPTPTD